MAGPSEEGSGVAGLCPVLKTCHTAVKAYEESLEDVELCTWGVGGLLRPSLPH